LAFYRARLAAALAAGLAFVATVGWVAVPAQAAPSPRQIACADGPPSCLNADATLRPLDSTEASSTTTGTNVTVAEVTADTVRLDWTGVSGATGYLVGRDGKDSTGGGAWSTTDRSTARERLFDKLLPDTAYTLFVIPQPGGQRVEITVRTLARSSPPPAQQPSSSPTAAEPSTASPAPITSQSPTAEPSSSPSATPHADTAAARLLGTSRSGLPWHSGVWLGGRFTTAQLNAFGVWRGRPADVTTTYGYRDSPELLAGNSWPITTWSGFGGRLNYGVPLATNDGRMTLASVASGQYDDTYRQVARNLVRYGRGDSIVRIGWEANLPDWKWYANAGNAATFKAAFRSASKAMRSAAPNLVVEFGRACGGDLDGSRDRLAALTTLYPGDDVVDLVGCDTYDWWNTKADGPDFSRVLKPAGGVGIQDVADFARAHAKGASYGEWGLAVRNNGNGGGDDPYYIESMFAFFQANADVVAFENYFDEPDPYIGNSLVVGGQNPRAAAVYRRLWGG
jgi:hypothetical protein